MTRAARAFALSCLLVSTVAFAAAAPAGGSVATKKKWKPPCSVVSSTDVGQILETSIASTKTQPGPVPSCQYLDGSSNEVVSIWLNGKPLGPAANTFAFDSDQAKGNDINRSFQPVAHIGKKAFFFESDGLNRLEVLVGKRLFFIDGPTLTLDQATAIAKRVIAKH